MTPSKASEFMKWKMQFKHQKSNARNTFVVGAYKISVSARLKLETKTNEFEILRLETSRKL